MNNNKRKPKEAQDRKGFITRTGGSGMLAPSEKHLEDYIWAHPEALSYDGETPVYSMVLRQCRVPSGIIDLIGFDYRLCVVELKQGILKAQALTQLMRYMGDVKSTISNVLSIINEQEHCHPFCMEYWDRESAFDMNRLTRGVLIGSDVEDGNFLTACLGCGVDVWTYDYEEGEYTFYAPDINPIEYEYDDCAAVSPLGAEFLRFYSDRIKKSYLKTVVPKSAVELAENYLETLDGES